jgi:chromosome segregation ATPase
MNDTKSCLGVITDPQTGKTQPCPKKGLDLMDNQFCAEHQPQCIHRLMKELIYLAQVLDQKQGTLSEQERQSPQWQNRVHQLKQLKQAVENYKSRCESDPSCRSNLQIELRSTIAAFANELKSSGQNIINEYQDVWSFILKMVNYTIETATLANSLMLQKEAAQQENSFLDAKIQDLEQAFVSQTTPLSQNLTENENEIKQMERELQKSQSLSDQSAQQVQSAKEKIKQTEQQSRHLAKEYAILLNQQKELEAVRQQNMEQQAIMQQMLTQMDQASGPIQKLQENFQKYQLDTQRRLDSITQTFQKQMSQLIEDPSPEGTYFDREAKLKGKIDELEESLAQMQMQLEAAQQDMAEAVERQTMMNVPQSHLGQRMLELAQEVKSKNSELAGLQARLDNATLELAQRDVQFSRQMDHLRESDRLNIQKMSDEIKKLHADISNREADLLNMRNEAHMKESQARQKLVMLTEERRKMINELQTLKAERESWKLNYEKRQADLTAQQNAMKAELQRQYESKKRELQYNFDQKTREKDAQLRLMKDELISKQNVLRVASINLEEQKRNLSQQEQKVEAMRQDYESKMANFLQQKNELRLELERAKEASKLAAERENTYQNNMDMLQQRNRALQHDLDTAIANYQVEMTDLRAQKERLMNQLNQVSAHRDTLLLKITQMTKDYAASRQQLMDLKHHSGQSIAQLQSELHSALEKVAAAEGNVTRCSSQLQQASMVHDHVKEMADEVKRLRNDVENRAKMLESNKEAIRTLMTDRDINRSDKLKLEAVLKETMAEKRETDLLFKQSKAEVNQLKQMIREMDMQIREKTQRIQGLLKKEQVAVEQERVRSEIKQQRYEQMAAKAEIEKELVYKENERLNKRKALAEKALVDEEIMHAQQLSNMMMSNDITAQQQNQDMSLYQV